MNFVVCVIGKSTRRYLIKIIQSKQKHKGTIV